MPEPSRRQQILELLLGRLQLIKVRRGFQTDAGKLVLLDEFPSFGESDTDIAIAMVVLPDEVGYTGVNTVVSLPIEIQAIARAELEYPWREAEAVLADIKKAIELEDRRLNELARPYIVRGTTRTMSREEGQNFVGRGITYVVPYVEGWGTP